MLVHTGAVEPIVNFMQAALEPGDAVIVQTPHYQALSEIARSIGCDVVPWLAREEHGWAPDLDELPKLITAKTRAVIVNLPHNPTGYLMTAGEQARLVEVCRAAGCCCSPMKCTGSWSITPPTPCPPPATSTRTR